MLLVGVSSLGPHVAVPRCRWAVHGAQRRGAAGVHERASDGAGESQAPGPHLPRLPALRGLAGCGGPVLGWTAGPGPELEEWMGAVHSPFSIGRDLLWAVCAPVCVWMCLCASKCAFVCRRVRGCMCAPWRMRPCGPGPVYICVPMRRHGVLFVCSMSSSWVCVNLR